MNDALAPNAAVLNPRQKLMRRRLGEDMAKILNRSPISAQDEYARILATEGDWIVAAQPVRQLPFAFCQMISLHQRDAGNVLLEEIHAVNNLYAGCSFRTVTVMLDGDPYLQDLRARTMAWGIEVADQLAFKLQLVGASLAHLRDRVRQGCVAVDGVVVSRPGSRQVGRRLCRDWALLS